MKWLCLVVFVCFLQISGWSLDREAFTFTKYALGVRVDPAQQRIGVRGKLTLRNDSTTPQKYLCLQISSSLGWRSIQMDGKPIDFISQTYASDIDHTGALSEAIVSLPREVASHGEVELNVGYEGTIALDTTRLERIGVPKKIAEHSDWDEIGKSFTAVRGVGYVTWYPVAMESASLADGNSVAETVGRWKQRHADSMMSVEFACMSDLEVFFSGTRSLLTMKNLDLNDTAKYFAFGLSWFGINVPTFVIANYQNDTVEYAGAVYYFAGQEDAAKAYASAVRGYVATTSKEEGSLVPVGKGSGGLRVLQLSDPKAQAFVTDGMFLTPLNPTVTPETELTFVYALAREMVLSRRAWIQEGLAHHAQVLYVEQKESRRAALDYLNMHRIALLDAEKSPPQNSSAGANNWEASHSLINAPDDIYLQTKAMNVWWMLRDMLGDNYALLAYQASDDKDPAYMQRLLEKQSHRDLEWFFDDWVYRDRGLPDFRVESAYPRKLVGGSYLVTVTIENLGNVGAEVPVILKIEGGEIRKRLEVRAKSKASIRIETASTPQAVTVNDGSVPESDVSNNSYEIKLADKVNEEENSGNILKKPR